MPPTSAATRPALSRSRRHRAARDDGAEGADGRRGLPLGPASQSVQGFSVEFAEYRQYLPGDDLSTLDWKVYARTDRHYVKKFEEETNLECHLLLDVSASMAYRGAAPMSKLEYGSVLAASLAFLMNRQRDATGLIAFDEHIVFRLPAGARPGHLHALLLALERLKPGSRSDVGRPLHQLAEALVKRSLVVLDLRSARRSGAGHQGAEAPALPRHRRRRVPGARSARADVPVPRRVALPRSRERRRSHSPTPRRSAKAYLRELATLTLRYDRELRGAGIDYVQLDTSQPLDFALLAYLSARAKRK